MKDILPAGRQLLRPWADASLVVDLHTLHVHLHHPTTGEAADSVPPCEFQTLDSQNQLIISSYLATEKSCLS